MRSASSGARKELVGEPFLHPKESKPRSKCDTKVMQRSELTVDKVTNESLDDGVLGAHCPVHVDHLFEDTTVVALQLVNMGLHIFLRGYELVDMTLHLMDRCRILCRFRRVAVLRFVVLVCSSRRLRVSNGASAVGVLPDRRRLALNVLHPFQVMDAELGMAERPTMFAECVLVGVLHLR
jgi:hypothetical protein